jgi:rifampicin phosphotransferase
VADNEYVLTLPDSRTAVLAVAGGKGASLARLAAGLPVPEGFAVTTAAYHRFVDENDLAPAILATVESTDVAGRGSLEAASRGIGELFARGRMCQDVADAVRRAYAELGGGDRAVAVRSSATAEDLPGTSFAGQQETYLNVRGEEELLEAVRRCWASLWTDRAIGYRLTMGIDQRSVSMAVVVQILVPAEVSGVLFTANPTTGARNEMVVSSSYGLGEASCT